MCRKPKPSPDEAARPQNAYSLFNLTRRGSGYAGAVPDPPDSDPGADPASAT